MEDKNLKTYHHGNLRDTLVSAGREILEREGPSSLTLREVARRAGVSHAAPAHHFPSLDHLLAEIAAQGFHDFVTTLGVAANLGNSGPSARLMAMGRAYIEFALCRPAIYTLMFRSNKNVVWTERLNLEAGAAWDQLATAVGDLLEKPAEDPCSRAGAVRVWSFVSGYASLKMDNRFPLEVDGQAIFESAIAALPSIARGS